MKYRILTLLGLLALGAGTFLQAQDYDDIYYDASKSSKAKTKVKVETPTKMVAVYGEVPDNYKVAAQSNYRIERDEDEYNRRGIYDPSNLNYEIDINGDTIFLGDSIYDEAFANTRLIERFYNPDIVILSDDEDLVELYYDESPTINLIVGSDWGYSSYWDSYYPWYTGWYTPWWYYSYRPWYSYHHWGWGWGYSDWYYTRWYGPRLWGWDYWGPRPWSNMPRGFWSGWDGGIRPHNGGHVRPGQTGLGSGGHRVGLASNRNGRGRIDATGSNRNGIGARGADGNRPSGVGSSTGRGSRGGYATGRGGGNMGSRGTSGVSSRSSSGVSRTPASNGGSRSYSGGSYSGGRSGGSSYSGGSRSSGSSHSGSSHSSGGGYSSGGGSRGSSGGGGGSHGGSSGGGGHRR